MAALIDQLVGHHAQRQSLLQALQAGHLPPALIFQGALGIGKKMLVRALLQVGLCERSVLACGRCSTCLRALEQHNEFVIEINPEGKKNISVDQVRQLQSELSLRSIQKLRFVIIDPADRLSPQASNALLKIMEEPPPHTHFFLITEKASQLLPTLRSRSQLVSFRNLSDQELEGFTGLNTVARTWSGGRMAVAQDLNDQNRIELLNNSLSFFYSLLHEEPQDWKKLAPWFFASEEERDFSFFIWQQALEKRLHGEERGLEFLPDHAGALSWLFEEIELLMQDLSRNVDKLLALENFYCRVKGGWHGSKTASARV